jgi:hypothetical protein
MFKRIFRWLNVYEKEVGLFLWSVALLFIVRSAGVILNNYAETAFLKRYGVEFLPVVNMLNAVATVVIMGFVFGLIRRVPGPRLLSWQFLLCGASILTIRLLVPLGYDTVYPLLFMLKAQYEALLAMLFWNLANDLFNTRQAKRLFPLITAGGVIGQILASFGTPMMATQFQFDNLLVVYLLITVTGAGVVWTMGRQIPLLLISAEYKESKPSRGSMLQEIKTVLPMLRSSVLMRIMIVLTFMPNVIIPILNYQFNYAVDTYFASESSMIEFFGYFRGVLNVISLIILLFVGKIYGRWGLPVALMFHPFNYVIAFLAFLLRFDIIAAMYARMSTNILRTTVNVPANAMVMGLFPESYRALVRPFLRGTVVRIALFIGSGLILISDTLFHPRYLSLVALPFVLGWLTAPFLLKKKYADILINLLRQNQLDLNTMKPSEVEQLFRGRKIQNRLKNALKDSPPETVLWYAKLLKQLNYPDLDNYLLSRIKTLDIDDQLALLKMLSDRPSKKVIDQLSVLAHGGNTVITVGVLQTMNRITKKQIAGFDRKLFLDHNDPEVRAHALAGLFLFASVEYGAMVTQWINTKDICTKKAGIIAAGASKERSFERILRNIINQDQTPEILSASIDSLHALDLHDLNDAVTPYLTHHERCVRLAAVSAFHVSDKKSLNAAIDCLADSDPQIRQKAESRIIRAPYVDGKVLIKALNHPNSALRERIYKILDKLQIKGMDLYLFTRDQLEGAYKYLNESNGIAALPANTARDLLLDHLAQQRDQIVRRVLRVLANQDQSRRIQIIRRGLMSKDRRQNANSQEALDDLLDKKISRILIPLLEDDGHQNVLDTGRLHYDLDNYQMNAPALLSHLLSRHDDWLSVVMTLYLLEKGQHLDIDIGRIDKLTDNGNPHIRIMSRRVMRKFENPHQQEVMDLDTQLALPDIVLKLKSVEIFEDLSVGELAAVASVTEDISYGSDETVIKEGEPGDTLYLILEGNVAVIKTEADGMEVTLDHISAGDHFGEMALFEEIPRTATIRTTEPCRMLFLHKQAFDEMVREYPQIALKICKVFSGRIRKLHQRFAHHHKS